ncbi:MAG: hypothetical protein SH821_14955 [Phototrophicales bacterium]|nr:hypothetical protein [Phototrophicales bacterium]
MKLLGIFLITIGLFIGASAQTIISPALDDHLTAIETYISETRGLPIITPVDRQFPTREEAIAFITAAYETELSPEIALEESLFYRALGFIPDNLNLREFYSAFMSDQVAGYYDTITKSMNTILLSGGELGDELPVFEQIIYAHEFTHALQDQHFDLTILQAQPQTTDSSLALLALIEGDATYMMQTFTFYLMNTRPDILSELMGITDLTDTAMLDNTPPIFLAEVNFSYMEGLAFINNIQLGGGWDAVNTVYDNLPVSTEQILHPEKYRAGELPIAVDIADMLPVLGDDWAHGITRTVGEFYLREYLKNHLRGGIAVTAARGWGGDALAIYHHADTDSIAWVMTIVWDSMRDEAEFERAYGEFLSIAYKQPTDDGNCVVDVGIAVCYVSDGNMTTITSAPDIQTAQAMVAGVGLLDS